MDVQTVAVAMASLLIVRMGRGKWRKEKSGLEGEAKEKVTQEQGE